MSGAIAPPKFVSFVISPYFKHGNRPELVAQQRVSLCMERELVSEQIQALQIEALEARRLAETLSDPQSILDLQNYAAQLEAEAARLGSRTTRNAESHKRRDLEPVACAGHSFR